MKMKGDRDWTSKDILCLGTLPDIEMYKNWPTKPMPEIVSPAKGREVTRQRKNTHRPSTSSEEGSQCSPSLKPREKVRRISQLFEPSQD